MAEICDQNFDVLCRLCLNRIDGDFVPIFDNDPIYHAATVKDKIYFITEILVTPEDRLPGQICGICDDRINDCYSFKQQSTLNNMKLLKYLQQQDSSNSQTLSKHSSPPRLHKRSPASLDDHKPPDYLTCRSPPAKPSLVNGTHVLNGSPGRKRKLLDSVTGDDDSSESSRKSSPGKEMSEAIARRVAVMRAGKLHRPSEQQVSPIAVKDETKEKLAEEVTGNDDKPMSKMKKSRVLWTMRTRGKARRRFRAMGRHLRATSRHEEAEPADHNDIFKYLRLHDVTRVASLEREAEESAAREEEAARRTKERKCLECEEKFATLHDLRDHKKATGHTIPGCAVCGKKFVSRDVRDNHVRKKHRRGQEGPKVKKTKERQCHECGVVYESLPELRAHQDKEGHRLAPVCKICGIIYKSYEAREKHMGKRHKGAVIDVPAKIRFHCNLCNKNFKSKVTLANHLVHHANGTAGGKKYACELCDERFTNTAELRVHFDAKHAADDTQMFQCLFCDATLSSSKALRSHFNRLHKPDNRANDELKHECATCLLAFGTKALLNAHARTHKMQRLELDPLRLHKLHECEVCGESFKYKAAKKNHVLKCHSSEDDGKAKPAKKVTVCSPVNKKKLKRHSYEEDPDF